MDQWADIEYTGLAYSPWNFLFDTTPHFTWEEMAEESMKRRYDYAIYHIKQQPFY